VSREHFTVKCSPMLERMSQVIDGDLVKVMSWSDYEWGYVSQMVREARRIASDIDGWRT
jgi:glyceraldehyde-3-phosphate dehydrogenase/erythrose-4-phosphate dehydrogenase